MAGYRPLALSSAARSIVLGGRTSYADRRRAAAERLSTTAEITQRLDTVIEVTGAEAESAGPSVPIDPDGTLRAAVRALLPLAYRTDDFDVAVSLGPGHRWAARIRRSGSGICTELIPGPGSAPTAVVPSSVVPSSVVPSPAGPSSSGGAPPAGPGLSEAEIAAELAALLWSSQVGSR